MTRYIAVAGAKGGVGKTAVSINLASALTEFGREAIVVDSDLFNPNIGVHLGITNVEKSLHTALSGDHKLHEAVMIHPSGLKVVCCHLSMDYMKHSSKHAVLKDLILDLDDKAEVVVLDSPPGINETLRSVLLAAGHCVLVTTPELAAITDCLKTARFARDLGVEILGVVVTKVKESGFEIDLDNIETILESPVIGIIPYDINLIEAQHHKHPVVYTHHNAPSTLGFKKLAANLIGETFEANKTKKEGVMKYLMKRTGLQE